MERLDHLPSAAGFGFVDFDFAHRIAVVAVDIGTADTAGFVGVAGFDIVCFGWFVCLDIGFDIDTDFGFVLGFAGNLYCDWCIVAFGHQRGFDRFGLLVGAVYWSKVLPVLFVHIVGNSRFWSDNSQDLVHRWGVLFPLFLLWAWDRQCILYRL